MPMAGLTPSRSHINNLIGVVNAGTEKSTLAVIRQRQ